MWQIVKSELKYNWYTLLILSVLFVLYTFYSFFYLQIDSEQSLRVDLSNGLFLFAFSIFILSMWGQRFKERRNRYFQVLPISVNHFSYGRFVFASFPFFVLILYFIIIEFILHNTPNLGTNSLLTQIGIMFIMFAGFIRARDDWYSHWDFGKRTQAAFISVSIIQIIVVAIFMNLSKLYKSATPLFGEFYYHYIKLLFFILGIVIMITTIFSYRKRKSYLS